MLFTYTCILLLGTSLALHSHYEHLDLDYVSKESRRLTYLSQDTMFGKIENNRKALQILMGRYDNMIKNMGEEEGK